MHWIWSLVTLITGRIVRTRMPRRGGCVYITFDDGPHPVHTRQLLALLETHGAKATFFLIGEQARNHPEVVREIVAQGHAIGNHSMTHPRMPSLPARAQLDDIARADAVLKPFNGQQRQIYRPPNGRATVAAIVSSMWHGRSIVLWNIDSLDYRLNADQVTARLLDARIREGDILLFHDDSEVALAALETLLPLWTGTGLRFAAI